MTDQEVFDVLRQIGRRIQMAAYILEQSQEGDAIRDCLPTLIEDTAEDVQELCLCYCAAPEPAPMPDQP